MAARAPTEADYDDEPVRAPGMKVNYEKPFNAEPEASLLIKNFVTPAEIFYVRTHGPTPNIDASSYQFVIEGLVSKPMSFTLHDMKTKFPRVSLMAALHCAGNRRREMSRAKTVIGVGWDSGAISNATWAGAPLRDVLLAVGVANDSTGTLHVDFQGAEQAKEGTGLYGSSVPLEKALSPLNDVILAYEMNGQPLTRDHGYPLRVVAAGYIGARSVKWLTKITVQTEESSNYFQRRDYKILPPNIDFGQIEAHWDAAPSLGELSINCAIIEPQEGEAVSSERPVVVRGWALAGGGRAVVRVDVSPDGGQTWVQAELVSEKNPAHYSSNRHFAWVLWRYQFARLQAPGQLVARAVDSSGNTQPEQVAPIWNLRGVNNNAWSRVNVRQMNKM